MRDGLETAFNRAQNILRRAPAVRIVLEEQADRFASHPRGWLVIILRMTSQRNFALLRAERKGGGFTCPYASSRWSRYAAIAPFSFASEARTVA
jgi:hypothetical protein